MRCKLVLREKKHSSVNKCSIPCAYYYRTEVRSCQEVQNICFIFNYKGKQKNSPLFCELLFHSRLYCTYIQ